MKKIYALYHYENELKMRITCEKHWEQQREFLENQSEVVVYWNDNLFLSFSRSALVEKGNQLKNEWLQKQYENISKIANINIRK